MKSIIRITALRRICRVHRAIRISHLHRTLRTTDPIRVCRMDNEVWLEEQQDNGGSGFGGAPFAGGMRTDGAQEMTVISKNTMIDGNIRSFADMKIDGNIKGNVETTKNININGKVVGDLTCDNISMKNSAVQGNVRLKGQAVMANDSMLIGDLTSQVAQLNGKIKGNIEISGKIQLDRDSVIIGDIKAGSIAISDGAVINGFVTTTYLSKDESANIFPESIALGE